MNVFYIEISAKNYELNHFSTDGEDDKSFDHSRFITINGDALFTSSSDFDLTLKENENKVEWPDSVSVIINQNYKNKNTKQFSYSGAYSDDDITVENAIEIAIDYNEEQFQNLWDMFLNVSNFKIIIEVGVSISSEKIVDVQDILLFKYKETLPVNSFNIKLVKI